MTEGLQLRPVQLLCLLCAQGGDVPEPHGSTIARAADAIRQRPDLPLTLRCLAQDVYAYQDVAPVADEPGSVEFHRKRDLDILQRLDLPPGATLPAREMLRLLFSRVPDTRAICRRDNPGLSVWWDGCGRDNCSSGNAGYAAGRKLLMHELDLQ